MSFLRKRLSTLLILSVASTSILFAGCGGNAGSNANNTEEKAAEATAQAGESAEKSEKEDTSTTEKEEAAASSTPSETEQEVSAETSEPFMEIDGLTFTGKTELQYAECFSVDNYEGGYSLINIPDSGTFLVVPEDGTVPDDLSDEVVVLQQPLDRIYLAATSAMALFAATDSVDHIRMSGTTAENWYVDEAVKAMKAGDILYAGKYSEPDYETLIAEDCDLAIESTMIYHTPKVKEMLEDMDIPVLVDRSSYEEHPLGRTEWIKMYAVLTGKQAEAESFFKEQSKVIEELQGFGATDKTVAFFFINSDGSIVVRGSSDYIPKMIKLAGANYIFDQVEGDGTSVGITMEEFYASAVDADYLIYNGSIDGNIKTISDLVKQNELFKDFKAVKEGNVWNTGKSFYQATDIVGQMIRDIHVMITDGSADDMTFLQQLK